MITSGKRLTVSICQIQIRYYVSISPPSPLLEWNLVPMKDVTKLT